jgi:signal recognition particle subunit SRP54
MQAVRKMGSMSKLLGMLPGMGAHRDAIENLDERELDRVSAIIQSMTPQERRDPKVLNGSRRRASPAVRVSPCRTSTGSSSASARRRR